MRGKRMFDMVVASLALVLTFPLWVFIIIVLWIVQGRPIFYLQQRGGLGGRKFWLFKFRTCRVDAAVRVTPYPEDVTPAGKFLRRWALDELPQLFNVLRGEMNIVGPRPVLPEVFILYSAETQRLIESVPPGLVSPWLFVRRKPADEIVLKASLEAKYAQKASWRQDLWLLLRAPLALLRGHDIF